METDEKQEKLHFVMIGGLKVYSPAASLLDCPKKHPCPDCHFCQYCSDARCQTCRCSERKN